LDSTIRGVVGSESLPEIAGVVESTANAVAATAVSARREAGHLLISMGAKELQLAIHFSHPRCERG
jgi:hypothetical protein